MPLFFQISTIKKERPFSLRDAGIPVGVPEGEGEHIDVRESLNLLFISTSHGIRLFINDKNNCANLLQWCKAHYCTSMMQALRTLLLSLKPCPNQIIKAAASST